MSMFIFFIPGQLDRYATLHCPSATIQYKTRLRYKPIIPQPILDKTPDERNSSSPLHTNLGLPKVSTGMTKINITPPPLSPRNYSKVKEEKRNGRLPPQWFIIIDYPQSTLRRCKHNLHDPPSTNRRLNIPLIPTV